VNGLEIQANIVGNSSIAMGYRLDLAQRATKSVI
jgi:hypothetical protein